MAGELKTEIVLTHTPELFASAVRRAAALLRAGELVALPTETVYGLAANAFDPRAVARIFEAKGRPQHNPIIVHVSNMAMARRCVTEWTPAAEQLAKSFWPGPLTLVLPRSPEIPEIVTAGGSTVGVRWPSHPFMQAVIAECGFPLAAPSANLSNQISPTNAEHVRNHLGGQIGLIVDGGSSQVGIESTVVDLSDGVPRVLRPGMIHAQALAAVLGTDEMVATDSIPAGNRTLKSPGLMEKHYAPTARLVVCAWKDEDDLLAQMAACRAHATGSFVIAHTRIPSGMSFGGVSVVPHDAEAYARALYAELHRCDNEGAELIIVEALPDGPEWAAISDRLHRAQS